MCPERFSIMGIGLPAAVPAPTATPAVPSMTQQPPAFPLGFASPPTPTAQQATNPQQPTYPLGFK